MNHQTKSIKNRTVMTTLTKIIVSTILSLLTFSCNFDFNFGINGNGNVTTTNRDLIGTFDKISTGRGLNVVLTQGERESVSVEADENLQDIIEVEIKGSTLNITTTENIASSASKTVYVTFDDLVKIETSSGSDVISEGTIETENLTLETSSGSDLELTLKANNIECGTSSGSQLTLKGTANSITASASSGSEILASNLETQSANLRATSGADISVNTKKELSAKANSGGSISYTGNPEMVKKDVATSGSVYSN